MHTVQNVPGKGFADFRNFKHFPTVGSLPQEDELNLRYYREKGFAYQPKHHWCFLGQIVEVVPLNRISLEVEDRLGNQYLVSCYTESRGFELYPGLAKVGNTVAVLYAHEHQFAFSPPGIRNEEPSCLTIFPVSLEGLMALSDRVKEFCNLSNGMRKCHGCGKTGRGLKKCTRCSMFEYCDSSCQKKGWTENGHKKDCKLLRNSDLKAMFHMNWGRFDDFVGFPLASEPSGGATQQPCPTSDPLVFVFSTEEPALMSDVFANLLKKLNAKAVIKVAKTAAEAGALLDQHPNPSGIFVADQGMANTKNKVISQRVVKYAREGGTVVVGGVFSGFISPPKLDKYFEEMWSLSWRFGSYHRTTLKLTDNASERKSSSLPKSYSQKAVHLKGVSRESAWYLPAEDSTIESRVFGPSPIENKSETPVAFEKVGNGWLGYTGDVNSEEGTTEVVLSMLKLL